MTRKSESFGGKELPRGWRWVELQEAARLVAGASAPQGKDSFSDSGPWFVRVSDLSGCDFDGVVRSTRDRLSELAIATKPLVRVPKGAVVLPKSGAAIATNRRAILGMDSYIVGHLLALIPIPEMILTEWLYFSLRQIDMIEHSENASYPSLKKSAVARITIPLPPLAEQKRLVASLESEIGAVEKARRAALDRVEAARALDSAFLREALEFDDGKLPPGWRWVELGNVCEVRKGVTPRREWYADSGLHIIKFRDIGGEINWKPGVRGRVGSQYEGKLRRLQTGMTLIGADAHNPEFIGRKVSFAGSIPGEPVFFSGELLAIAPKPDNRIASKWPFLWFSSQSGYTAVQEKVVGVHLNSNPAKTIEIPLPPLAEQNRIIAALNAKMTIAKQTRAAAEAELEAIEALPAALLRRAFRTTS